MTGPGSFGSGAGSGGFGEFGQSGFGGGSRFGPPGQPGQPGQFGPGDQRGQFSGGFMPANDDYRFGGAPPVTGGPGGSGHKAPFGRRMASMPFFGAPIPLLVAFVLQLVSAGVVVWRLVEKWRLPERPTTGIDALGGYEEQIAAMVGSGARLRPDDILETTIFWGIIIAVVLLMAFFTVKGENWARIVLTLLCIAGVFLLVVEGLAIAGLASVLALPLLWLPVNKPWFGDR